MNIKRYKDTYYFISDQGEVFVNQWIAKLTNPTIYKTKSNTYQSSIYLNKKNYKKIFKTYEEALIYNTQFIKTNFKEYKKVNLYKTSHGYFAIAINKKHYKIHRLVAQLFLPNLENKPEVNHIIPDKTRNNVENLEWTTSKENMGHARQNQLCNTKYQSTTFYIPKLNLTFKGSWELYNYFESLGYKRLMVNQSLSSCLNPKKTHKRLFRKYTIEVLV
jgi:hypothetical protein